MKIGDRVKIVNLKDPEDFLENYKVRHTNVYVGEYGVITEPFLDQYVVKFDNNRVYVFHPEELQNVSGGG